MFSLFKPKSKLSISQRAAEQEAVKMLLRAQQLLAQSPQNVEEAQKIRFAVTHRLLPPHRLRIARQHSRSLLLDVDRRIEKAHIKNMIKKRNQASSSTRNAVHERNQRFLQERQRKRARRYSHTAAAVQQEQNKTLLRMMLIIAASVALLIVVKEFIGQNELYNSFHWLQR